MNLGGPGAGEAPVVGLPPLLPPLGGHFAMPVTNAASPPAPPPGSKRNRFKPPPLTVPEETKTPYTL